MRIADVALLGVLAAVATSYVACSTNGTGEPRDQGGPYIPPLDAGAPDSSADANADTEMDPCFGINLHPTCGDVSPYAEPALPDGGCPPGSCYFPVALDTPGCYVNSPDCCSADPSFTDPCDAGDGADATVDAPLDVPSDVASDAADE